MFLRLVHTYVIGGRFPKKKKNAERDRDSDHRDGSEFEKKELLSEGCVLKDSHGWLVGEGTKLRGCLQACTLRSL
jgi:hypothetical protein